MFSLVLLTIRCNFIKSEKQQNNNKRNKIIIKEEITNNKSTYLWLCLALCYMARKTCKSAECMLLLGNHCSSALGHLPRRLAVLLFAKGNREFKSTKRLNSGGVKWGGAAWRGMACDAVAVRTAGVKANDTWSDTLGERIGMAGTEKKIE